MKLKKFEIQRNIPAMKEKRYVTARSRKELEKVLSNEWRIIKEIEEK